MPEYHFVQRGSIDPLSVCMCLDYPLVRAVEKAVDFVIRRRRILAIQGRMRSLRLRHFLKIINLLLIVARILYLDHRNEIGH